MVHLYCWRNYCFKKFKKLPLWTRNSDPLQREHAIQNIITVLWEKIFKVISQYCISVFTIKLKICSFPFQRPTTCSLNKCFSKVNQAYCFYSSFTGGTLLTKIHTSMGTWLHFSFKYREVKQQPCVNAVPGRHDKVQHLFSPHRKATEPWTGLWQRSVLHNLHASVESMTVFIFSLYTMHGQTR